MDCYCCSNTAFESCCEPLITRMLPAGSAEALMRSRYSAYVLGEGDYLVETAVAQRRVPEDAAAIRTHAAQTEWLKLEVLHSEERGEKAVVEFKAYFRSGGRVQVHHEKSYFVKTEGRWYYDEGRLYEAAVGRNEPCPCGSGKKYKQCCGRAGA